VDVEVEVGGVPVMVSVIVGVFVFEKNIVGDTEAVALGDIELVAVMVEVGLFDAVAVRV
jgi:hypothetical protein